jgi:hypothetical protein
MRYDYCVLCLHYQTNKRCGLFNPGQYLDDIGNEICEQYTIRRRNNVDIHYEYSKE